MTELTGQAENTDKEIWRGPPDENGDTFYSPSIHVTQRGGIGFNVGGDVIVKPIEEWHSLARRCKELEAELDEVKGYGPIITDQDDMIDTLKFQNAALREALESIANNTCCEGCQEAAKWAKEALATTPADHMAEYRKTVLEKKVAAAILTLAYGLVVLLAVIIGHWLCSIGM